MGKRSFAYKIICLKKCKYEILTTEKEGSIMCLTPEIQGEFRVGEIGDRYEKSEDVIMCNVMSDVGNTFVDVVQTRAGSSRNI